MMETKRRMNKSRIEEVSRGRRCPARRRSRTRRVAFVNPHSVSPSPTSKQASSHIYGLTAAPVKIHHIHTPQYGTESPQQTPHRPHLVSYPRKPPPHGSILFSQHHPPTQTRPTICDKNSTDTPPPPWGFAVDTTPCVSCLYTPP